VIGLEAVSTLTILLDFPSTWGLHGDNLVFTFHGEDSSCRVGYANSSCSGLFRLEICIFCITSAF
jgi:hypothetical protein